MTRVFVYGTLKRGGSNHRSLAGQRFVAAGRTVSGYTLYSLGDYPGMIRSADPAHFVTGEIWEVNTAGLTVLDDLEGVAEGLYERVVIQLEPPFADKAAESYLYLRSLAGRRAIGATWPV